MAKDALSRLPALKRTVALARSQGLSVEPYWTLQKMGPDKRPYAHKKKMRIDSVLCAVSSQSSCWVVRSDHPNGLKLTQVHAPKGRATKSTPKVLIFDIQLGSRTRSGIWCVTRKEFLKHFPSGHANIPTGSGRLAPRGKFNWERCRGGAALKKCIESVQERKRQK